MVKTNTFRTSSMIVNKHITPYEKKLLNVIKSSKNYNMLSLFQKNLNNREFAPPVDVLESSTYVPINA